MICEKLSKRLIKKRSTAISEAENKCKEMFEDDENVSENQAKSQLNLSKKILLEQLFLKIKKELIGRGLSDVREHKM